MMNTAQQKQLTALCECIKVHSKNRLTSLCAVCDDDDEEEEMCARSTDE